MVDNFFFYVRRIKNSEDFHENVERKNAEHRYILKELCRIKSNRNVNFYSIFIELSSIFIIYI